MGGGVTVEGAMGIKASVTDASYLEVGFPGITDVAGLSVADRLCAGVLAGDVNGDLAVNIFDLRDIRLFLDESLGAGNFMKDVNADGVINIFDLRDTRLILDTALVAGCP